MNGSNLITLAKDDLKVCLDMPGTGYRGTRFDWTGVFRSIDIGSKSFVGTWYETENAVRHDNVCGPSEEFSPLWVDDIHCVKPGVGVLKVPEGRSSYDRFRLYEIADSGTFGVNVQKDSARFIHELSGWYRYEKAVLLVGDAHMRIEHRLAWLAPDGGEMTCYNHNFFTMGKKTVGASRSLVFDGQLSGDWRPDSVGGYIDGQALRFERTMQMGQKCFIGNLAVEGMRSEPYHFIVCEETSQESSEVDVRCDAPMEYAVFWSNHRVACVEPYVRVPLTHGREFVWCIDYMFLKK